ncbi:phosphopyruvate hydratase [Patescibacteria group bacterium]
MSKIKNIRSREILDSRGVPTLETTVICDNGVFGIAMVPSGASKGKEEAWELRDEDNSRYSGKGVKKAVNNVNQKIARILQGVDIEEQSKIDQIMIKLDNTNNKSRLGANAILSVSLAASRAATKDLDIPLYKYLSLKLGKKVSDFLIPTPMMNIINGGAHADNNLDIQEYMIIPGGAGSFHQALEWGSRVFNELHELLKDENLSTGVGDEGGFSPNLESNKEALVLIMQAIEKAKLTPGKDIYLALDVAANMIYKDDKYVLEGGTQTLTTEGMINLYHDYLKNFPIISIEDPFAESDKKGWEDTTNELGSKVQLVGDDLFATNPVKLNFGINQNLANSVLIKPNQIGTLTETLKTVKIAAENRYSQIISHRSGETEDTYIADLAVGTSCGQIKTGSLTRSERVAKYNRLLQIEIELAERCAFTGISTLPNYKK